MKPEVFKEYKIDQEQVNLFFSCYNIDVNIIVL